MQPKYSRLRALVKSQRLKIIKRSFKIRSMINILAIGATIAGVVAILAYVPQVAHLIKVKDSKGISFVAWLTWFLCNFILLIYAVSIKNIPYVIVYFLSCLANLTIIFLTAKYKNKKA